MAAYLLAANAQVAELRAAIRVSRSYSAADSKSCASISGSSGQPIGSAFANLSGA